MPSRLSAEASDRAARDTALASVAIRGYATDYRGVRITKSGRRFWIEQVTLRNVLSHAGAQLGQAAIFRRTSPA